MKYPPKDRSPQLFDLKADPYEKVDLSSKHPELLQELSTLIWDWYPVPIR
jgi:hypothetical protein